MVVEAGIDACMGELMIKHIKINLLCNVQLVESGVGAGDELFGARTVESVTLGAVTSKLNKLHNTSVSLEVSNTWK